MARCKRTPNIFTLSVPASPATATLKLPTDTVAFVLRPRTPVGFTIALEGTEVEYFSIGAAETYTEENLSLEGPLHLVLSAASAVTVEVWSWGV